MKYHVRARIIDARIPEFFEKLTNGEIAAQRPDGEEICASMRRAVVDGSGMAEWYESCFCDTPLKHERETQYDLYFTDFETRSVEDFGELTGSPLWSHMEARAGA